MTLQDPNKPQRDARIDALGNDDRSVLILKDILRDFNKDMQAVYEQIGPVRQAVDVILGGGTGIGQAPAPTNLTCMVGLQTIFLSWDEPSVLARTYEVRRSGELVWETASFVTRTPSLSVHLPPLPTGSYYFLVKTMDSFGAYSETFASVVAVVNAPGKVSVTAQVIDNNVLLRWDTPTTSFTIDRFRIYRGETLFGATRGSFTSIFETVAGDYTYGIEAIDIAGNAGTLGYVTVHVNTPPDYQLESRRDSTFTGLKINAVLTGTPGILVCVDIPENWTEHFIEDSWDQPSDQTDAGYPVYIQPTVMTASYEEIIDYGTVIENTIVTVSYQITQLVPEVFGTISMRWSSDNITWTPFVVGGSHFVESLRYLIIKLEFTALNDKSLAEVYALVITLDVKREIDSGDITALYWEPTGTYVGFHKPFKDVDSITCTADSIEPIIIIYDFVDAPNPLGFRVYALDSTGNRVTYLVSWKARGIT